MLSEDFLKKYLKLENGIPSADTILRVLAGIGSRQLEKFFCEYTKGIFQGRLPQQEVIAIDGKTIRRSESAGQKAAHVVSAFASSPGVCFGQVKTEEKSNEITAIPELLDLLNLKEVIVTLAEKDEWAELLRKDCSAQNLNVIRKITMNLLAATDFSDIIKKTKIPLSHKRTLCIKRENCLLRVLQNL